MLQTFILDSSFALVFSLIFMKNAIHIGLNLFYDKHYCTTGRLAEENHVRLNKQILSHDHSDHYAYASIRCV